MPQLERAVALATVALSESAPIVMLDQPDSFAQPADEPAFLTVVERLAQPETTLLVGTPSPYHGSGEMRGRPVTVIDLRMLDTVLSGVVTPDPGGSGAAALASAPDAPTAPVPTAPLRKDALQ